MLSNAHIHISRTLIRVTVIPVFFFYVMSLQAEVIVTKGGSLMIGEITGRSATSTEITAFGQKHVVEAENLLATTETIEPYIKRGVLVVLTDTSVVRGKLRDYSEDIGLYVDSEIGPLTIPSSKIDHIIFNDSEMAKPPPLVIYRLGLLGQTTYGFLSDSMGLGLGGTFLGEMPIPSPWVPTIGFAATYESISASQPSLRFTEMSTYVYVRQTLYPLKGALKRLGFAFTVGGGSTFGQIHDSRASNTSPNAEIQGIFVFKTGIEVTANQTMRIRFDFANFLRTVRGGNMWKSGLELGAIYVL
jgi:hypothetical protein